MRIRSLAVLSWISASMAFSCLGVVMLTWGPTAPLSAHFGGPPPGPPPAPRVSAPVDLTGYWVSLVTEDWRARMTTPSKGDFESVPLNGEGRKAAAGWDGAK